MSDGKDEDVKFTNLTEEDIDRIIRKLNQFDNKQIKEIHKIYDKFSQAINGLITTVRTYIKEEEEIVEIDRLKRIIGFLPVDERFLRCSEKIWSVRNYIINKDMKYFLNKDLSHAIKKDSKQRMIETLIEIVKERFPSLSKEQQDIYWNKSIIMLNCVAQFKKLTGEV